MPDAGRRGYSRDRPVDRAPLPVRAMRAAVLLALMLVGCATVETQCMTVRTLGAQKVHAEAEGCMEEVTVEGAGVTQEFVGLLGAAWAAGKAAMGF